MLGLHVEGELAEVDMAEELMEKERAEMVLWKQRAVRAWETYEDLKREHNLEHDDDGEDEFATHKYEELIKESFPEVFKARRHANSINARFNKEN